MVIWAGLQAKLDGGGNGQTGIDWLIWKMILSLKTFLYRINLFVNVTEAMKLNNYFQIKNLRILL